jgi:hypothetical protein
VPKGRGGSQWYGFPTGPDLTTGFEPTARCAATPIEREWRPAVGEWSHRLGAPDPKCPSTARASARTIRAMQLIQPSHAARPARAPLLMGTVVGGVLLAGGLVLAWLAFMTPIIRSLTPAVVRPTPEQIAIGGVIWGVCLVAPPAFAIVGFMRLSQVAGSLIRKAPPGPVAKGTKSLPDDYTVAPLIDLPDGRRMRNVVVGPFGLAVIGEAPPRSITRRSGSVWEVRGPDGRWMPLEAPIERTARDAERLRRWIGAEERDFVVKVYAAFVTEDPTIYRTPACAVIGPNEVAAWLAALPPQRSLYDARREDLIERIRALA